MICYHGTPLGGPRIDVGRFLKGRHALIPFPRPEDLGVSLSVCQTVVVDNGAFSAWKSGNPVTDWFPYYEWLETFYRHPAFQWAIIPDVIDGDEDDNDILLDEWPSNIEGVPVWHLHESLDRLARLLLWPRIAFGSSGEYHQPGSPKWERRMIEAMEVCCDENGMMKTKVHGLRMADPRIATRFPFASVDSTNVAQNKGGIRTYPSPTDIQRAETIAARMEHEQSPGHFTFSGQMELSYESGDAQYHPTTGKFMFNGELEENE